MAEFWSDRPPLFVHRLGRDQEFKGERFATVDEGDEVTVISPDPGPQAIGPYACLTMGPFDLSLVGILAQASTALAQAGTGVRHFHLRHDHSGALPSPGGSGPLAGRSSSGRIEVMGFYPSPIPGRHVL